MRSVPTASSKKKNSFFFSFNFKKKKMADDRPNADEYLNQYGNPRDDPELQRPRRRYNLTDEDLAQMVAYADERQEEERRRLAFEELAERRRLLHDDGGDIFDVPLGVHGRKRPTLSTTQKLRRARDRIGGAQRIAPPPPIEAAPTPPRPRLGKPRRRVSWAPKPPRRSLGKDYGRRAK